MGNIAQWAQSLMQPCRVCEEGLRVVKALSAGRKALRLITWRLTLPAEEAPANSRASSRGNTEGASVNRNYWA